MNNLPPYSTLGVITAANAYIGKLLVSVTGLELQTHNLFDVKAAGSTSAADALCMTLPPRLACRQSMYDACAISTFFLV